MEVHDDMKLSEAQGMFDDALADTLGADAIICPCCRRDAKVYRRNINSGMAYSLIRMYRIRQLQWQHISTTVGTKAREESKLAWWGLVEKDTSQRRADGAKAGIWRVTPKGQNFVLRNITMPKYALEFAAKCITLYGDPITIDDALGTKFSYTELMSGK